MVIARTVDDSFAGATLVIMEDMTTLAVVPTSHIEAMAKENGYINGDPDDLSPGEYLAQERVEAGNTIDEICATFEECYKKHVLHEALPKHYLLQHGEQYDWVLTDTSAGAVLRWQHQCMRISSVFTVLTDKYSETEREAIRKKMERFILGRFREIAEKPRPSRLILGATISVMRQRKGWSIDELAANAHVSVNAIERIENGMFSPKFETLQKIANALGANVSIV